MSKEYKEYTVVFRWSDGEEITLDFESKSQTISQIMDDAVEAFRAIIPYAKVSIEPHD